MKCPYCESDQIDGAQVCTACGSPLAGNSPNASTSESATQIPQPDPLFEPDPVVQADTPPAQMVTNFDIIPPPGNNAPGMAPSSSIGLISLILGIIGLILSCVGCGGLISIVGAITGFISLKTSSRSKGIIGIILSGLGLVVSLIVVCLFLVLIFYQAKSGNIIAPGG
jgi:hypothetical protein